MNVKGVVILLTIVCTIAGEQDVLELSDDDFEIRIVESDTTLVMFYSPLCIHCKQLIPELDKASELLRGSNPRVALAKVNCATDGKDTCLEYSITEYPILKIFRRNQAGQNYVGSREAESIAKYLRNRYGSPSHELFTLVDIDNFLKIQEPAIIGFFEKETDLKTAFLGYADHFKEDYRFAYSSAVDVLSKYNEKNSIAFFRASQYHNKFEPNFVLFEGNTSLDLLLLVNENLHGLVGHRTPENEKDFEKPYVIAYYPIDYTFDPKGTNYWRNRILKVAKDYSRDFTFAISSSEDYRKELKEYGYGYTGERPVIAARDKNDHKFKMNAEFSIEHFKQFVSDLKEGKLKPYVNSAAIPATNDEPVKVAVAKNFEEIVINNDKDTFVEFYAPWCDYCENLVPVYDELGTKMLDEDVEIVKFDTTVNDVPKGFDIAGYPTFYWLPKNSKIVPIRINFKEVVTLEHLIKYIAEHSTNELRNYDRSGNPKKAEL